VSCTCFALICLIHHTDFLVSVPVFTSC